MTTEIITKYRVEEHYTKATIYLLHGSYNIIKTTHRILKGAKNNDKIQYISKMRKG